MIINHVEKVKLRNQIFLLVHVISSQACLAAVAFAEPEAEVKAAADPYLLYGGYGYAGHHLGYAGYGGYPYRYGHVGYYGKREADAEPEAKADPYLLYGGYGHGYAGHLGYAGHYGYPYAGYAYYG